MSSASKKSIPRGPIGLMTQQVDTLWRQILATYSVVVWMVGAGSVLLALAFVVHTTTGATYGSLTRDPNAVADLPNYVGFLSQIGIFLWASCVAVCAFAATLLSNVTGRESVRRFLWCSAYLNLLLGLDDALMIHEAMPAIGVSEAMVTATYAVLVAIYLVGFFAVILQSNFYILVLALLCFAVSAIMDVWKPWWVLPEDSAKLFGLLLWHAYFVSFAYAVLKTNLTPSMSERPPN